MGKRSISELSMIGDEVVKLYASGKSTSECAEILGTNKSAVRIVLLQNGVTFRTISEGIRTSSKFREYTSKPSARTGTKLPKEWRENISKARLEWGEQNSKGTSLKPSGYIEITRGPNKGRTEHIVVAEQTIGRKLKPGEVVHHIDGNKRNNSPENLQVMSNSDHLRMHRLQDWRSRSRTALGRLA